MNNAGQTALGDVVLYIVASIVALVAIVVISEWMRGRREREIYERTRRDALDTVAKERQPQRRAASS